MSSIEILKEIRQRLDYGSWATIIGMENDLEGLQSLQLDNDRECFMRGILVGHLSEAIEKRKAVITLDKTGAHHKACIALYGEKVVNSWTPNLN